MVLGDASVILLIVIWSRVHGQAGMGHYSFALGVTGFFVVIPASALMYAATLVLFKETRSSEVRTLVGVVRRSR